MRWEGGKEGGPEAERGREIKVDMARGCWRGGRTGECEECEERKNASATVKVGGR